MAAVQAHLAHGGVLEAGRAALALIAPEQAAGGGVVAQAFGVHGIGREGAALGALQGGHALQADAGHAGRGRAAELAQVQAQGVEAGGVDARAVIADGEVAAAGSVVVDARESAHGGAGVLGAGGQDLLTQIAQADGRLGLGGQSGEAQAEGGDQGLDQGSVAMLHERTPAGGWRRSGPAPPRRISRRALASTGRPRSDCACWAWRVTY